jgi:Tfp pilus assembly protein PilV
MGFSLLDAMLGSTIFLFGALASAPLLVESARASQRSLELLDATSLAQRHLSELKAAIRNGKEPEAAAVEEDGFNVVQSSDRSDPDFYRLSVSVFSTRSSRMLVELISLVERP